ncbi:MAG: metallophosphoesterase [Kiritimatiellia bacterium]|nr:metallophosphoesterase [Kiritimatiellia bacterium]
MVLSDLHDAATEADGSRRRSTKARLLLRRFVNRCNRFLQPDALLIAGDLLEDGAALDAPARYEKLREILDTLKMPWLIVPGNHDAEPDVFYRFLPRPPEPF